MLKFVPRLLERDQAQNILRTVFSFVKITPVKSLGLALTGLTSIGWTKRHWREDPVTHKLFKNFVSVESACS